MIGMHNIYPCIFSNYLMQRQNWSGWNPVPRWFTNLVWINLEQFGPCVNRLRSTHCREFMKLCRPAHFFRQINCITHAPSDQDQNWYDFLLQLVLNITLSNIEEQKGKKRKSGNKKEKEIIMIFCTFKLYFSLHILLQMHEL